MNASGARSGDEARLACSSITVHFGGLAAVSNVDLSVPPATIVLVTDGSEDCPLGVNTEVMLPDVSTVTL